MKFEKLYINLFLFFFIGITYSQSRDEEQLQKGVEYVYHIKFDSANAIFQSLVNKYPDDPTGYFMLAMSEWWHIYLNKEDESNDDNYLSKVDKCIELCDKKLDANENDDWVLFLKGGVIGYRGFFQSFRDNWLRAVDDGKQGLSLLQRSYELNPNNKDAIFGVGLYNYAVDYFSEKYDFIKPLLFLFPKGNRELGLSQIKDCSENAKLSKTEAKFVLCYVNLQYEKNYTLAEQYADTLSKMYPENPMALKFLGRSYEGELKWTQSLGLWRDLLNRCDSSQPGFSTKYARRETIYNLGLSLHRLNMFDEAMKYYLEALDLSKELDKNKESPYQVFSALGLGMLNDIKGNHNEAVKYYNMVIDMRDIDNSRDSAKEYKEHGYK